MTSTFKDLNITPPILKALEEMGFEAPTEVQSRAIPHLLNREDLIAMSKTGSGKTAVFGVSLLQLMDPAAPGPQVLILTPTRELAVQVDGDIKKMAKYLPYKTTAVYGQHSMKAEIDALKKNVAVVTGTPGRVFDHITHGTLHTGHIRFLVLDEADRMLDMGFIDQVFRIIKTVPKNRMTLLFSATIPPEVRRICQHYMKNPVTVEIESSTKTVDTIHQWYHRVAENEKRLQLNRVLQSERPESCMIFCNTRFAVDRVQDFLMKKGYPSRALHGDIAQSIRLRTMEQFKRGEFNILVATDVASRGIHIDSLALVINYDVPQEKDSYIHRIGRTGRAGNGGRAVSLVTGEDIMNLYAIEEHIGAMIPEMPLPTEAELNERRAEIDKWVKDNMPKIVPVPAAAKPAHKPNAQKAQQRGAAPKPASGKSGQQNPRQREQRPGEQQSKRPARQQGRPLPPRERPARPVSAAVNDINRTQQGPQAGPAQEPSGNKTFLQRVFQRFFGK
ncbi:MAG: DEAD/DEAH box helicase [Clostridia bacterium]|jgi:superfamily II DNA/RNA helicase|nr:DEAD/DEAH box helicase [Clostridia bacterium]